MPTAVPPRNTAAEIPKTKLVQANKKSPMELQKAVFWKSKG